MNKTVIITTNGAYTHGGLYIHNGYWHETIRNNVRYEMSYFTAFILGRSQLFNSHFLSVITKDKHRVKTILAVYT